MNYFFTLLIFLLLFTTCKKRVFDFRNEYTGEYVFSGYEYDWSAAEGYGDTTYFNEVNGELSYTRKDDRDVMNLQLKEKFSSDIIIDKSGEFILCSGKGNIDSDLNLAVTFDKYICDFGKPSLGGRHMYFISGRKK